MKKGKITVLLLVVFLTASAMLFAAGRQEVDTATDHGPLVSCNIKKLEQGIAT